MSAIRELYQEVILDHNRSPRNFRRMENATQTVEGFNPLCGDHYTVYLNLEGEIIQDISFYGSGCAISKASASVMSALLKGKTRQDVREAFTMFHSLVMGELDAEKNAEKLGKLVAFSGVSEFPARVKCASLAWHTVLAAIDKEQDVVSTE